MQIFLKNGDELSLEDGARCSDAAKAVSESLARNAVAAKINGKLTDLSAPLSQGDKDRLQAALHRAERLLRQKHCQYL